MMQDYISSQFAGLKAKELRIYPVQAVWNASLAVGSFTFNSTASILTVDPNSWYSVIEIDVGGNISENLFSNAIDLTYNPNGFQFNFGSQYLGSTLFSLAPFAFSIFRRNVPCSYAFKTGQNKLVGNVYTRDVMQSSIYGRLTQTADIIAQGITSISIYAYFTIVQVTNPDWIARNVGNV